MASHTQFELLSTRRFLPLFITQFLGAFNDNVFKSALVILITYSATGGTSYNPQIMITAAAGIFILPFFLFSATAGDIADKFEKSLLIRTLKLIEIGLMCLAILGFYLQSTSILLLILFLMGTQSTFFGPIKYSILPDLLKKQELIGGTALIETATFIAILLGTIIGGLLILTGFGMLVISLLVLSAAFAGWYSSFHIPKAPIASKKLSININIFEETWKIIKFSNKRREVFLSILGISWFWFIGATFLSQFPTFAKDIIGGNEYIFTLFLTTFSVGIGVGSLFCNRMLKGEIHATYVPLAAFGITIFALDLYFASSTIPIPTGDLIGMGEYFSALTSWRILFDLLLIAICSGIYIVPLYAVLQTRSKATHRSRAIASNNVINALFMVFSAILTSLLLWLDYTVTHVFLMLAVLNGFIAIYICKLIPDAAVRSIVRWLLRFFYRVEVKGLENYQNAPERLVIIANHTSYLDAALIAAFVNKKLTFAINTIFAEQWWMKPLLYLVNTYKIDAANPMSTKSMIEFIRQNKQIVIFPEGRLTMTGALMKIYEGPSMIAYKSGAEILPVYIEGAQYSYFSRLKGKVPIKWFPKITIRFLKTEKFKIPENLQSREKRRLAGLKLYDLMTKMTFECSDYKLPLYQSLLDTRSFVGGKHIILEDIERKPMNYNQLITKCSILGRKIANSIEEEDTVGLLLPNVNNAIVSFFALQAYGITPAMLNYSTGNKNVAIACRIAKLKRVYTARRFVEIANLEGMIDSIEKVGVKIIYLEDFVKGISIFDKLIGYILGKRRNALIPVDPNEPAVILFTSGSEGAPKGVVLSHTNLQANRYQLASRIDFGPSDIVFNALPIFHTFGLTGGMIMPLLSGIKTFSYPSPLHYRIVPELVYDINASIMFGTDTFLSGYAKYAHPYDFYSIRYVFAGAEKLKEETRKIWSEKFGVRLFEGYGATETAPVISTNTPMQNKTGTVGRLMPSINIKLKSVPGIKEGKRLYVNGPNVMKGYLDPKGQGDLIGIKDGWYDTGDIVSIDEDGYLTICGRAKRFAKVGGEMVSLTAIEQYVSELWPEFQHAVIYLEDEKKGEIIVLVTNYDKASRNEIVKYVKAEGIAEISIPARIEIVSEVPLLGSGKIDYGAVTLIFNK